MRSHDESSTAPNFEARPPARATAPSTRSSITKPQTSMVPVNHAPRVKKTSALATAPTVPMMVITSGVTPARANRAPSGPTALAKKDRAWMLSTL